MACVLYITYNGLLEPLGQSQVFQYLKKLANNHKIILVSYEKAHDWAQVPKRDALMKLVKDAGILWLPLRYHKRPSGLATLYDLIVGIFVCVYLSVRHRTEITHARSYIPSVIALILKRLFKKRYLFDMRGFWADERVDGGIWQPNSRLYHLAKWFEKKFLTHADVVVSLTHAGVTAMRQFPYLKNRPPQFEVIPTCTNLDLFQPIQHSKNKKADLFTLGYVGSVGTWYLFDQVLECFKILLKICPDSRLLIINRSEHEYIQERLRMYGISEKTVEMKAAEHATVGAIIAQEMDAGIFFIKPVFSKKASSPTKMGEFLACGIPCLANSNVGDVEKILVDEVGVVIHDFSAHEQEQAIRNLLSLVENPETKKRCVAVAHQYFSLDNGVRTYEQIYHSLLVS
jgi:glycosyltransferase involved in cell wall biosynthesis